MDSSIKKIIDSVLDFCEVLEGVVDLEEISVKQAVNLDLMQYLLYLSAADGHIADEEAQFIKDYFGWDLKPDEWKRFIQDRHIYSTSFEEKIPVSLTIFVKAYKAAIRINNDFPDICDMYIEMFEAVGMYLIASDGNCDKQEMQDWNTYMDNLKSYVADNICDDNIITKEDDTSSKREKGIKKENIKFLKCPNCGKLLQNKGTYCTECYEDYDEMFFEDKNYIHPISEVTYYEFESGINEKEYKTICFLTQSSGFIISPKTFDEYIKDYFCEPFLVERGKIVEESVSKDSYVKYGDYLYNADTLYSYSGEIPESNYFEAYFYYNQYVKPIWFFPDGRVIMYDGTDHDGKISDEGIYIRDGEIIRAEMYKKETGEKYTRFWLIVEGTLCRDAYANEDAIKRIKKLSEKPLTKNTSVLSGYTITKEEFFNNYPCEYCNARRTFVDTTWDYRAFGSISVSGRCKKCNNYFVECGEPKEIKRIAYKGSEPNPYLKPAAGATRYMDNPCPYCGSYEVRHTKWSDKQMSAAFWGFFSYKLHTNYKCDNCGKMWE